MNVVGLDLSLTATGFADAYGTQVIKPKLRGAERLAFFRDHFAEIFIHDQPHLVVIEEYAFSKGDAHSHGIGELGGVIRLLCFDMGIPVAAVLPNLVKIFATGKGAHPGVNSYEKKLPIIEAALATGAELPSRVKKTGEVIYDDNAADAFWLRQMGVAMHGDLSSIAIHQRDALYKTVWPVLGAAA